MTNPLKPGMRVEYVHANEPWQATVARVDGELFWLRDYSDGDDTESVYWHWSPDVFRILTPDYPKYARLDDIPITPGRVEWSGEHVVESEYEVHGKTSASYNQYVRAASNSPEHRYGAAVGLVIHDFANALCGPESDEAWLEKRGWLTCNLSRLKTGMWSTSFGQTDDRGMTIGGWWTTKAAAFAALRRAVEAIESGET